MLLKNDTLNMNMFYKSAVIWFESRDPFLNSEVNTPPRSRYGTKNFFPLTLRISRFLSLTKLTKTKKGPTFQNNKLFLKNGAIQELYNNKKV